MATISIPSPVRYLHTAIIEENNHSVAELYAHHRDFLYRVAMRMLRNADDAEDVVQNVFLRMMRNDHAPDEGRSAVGYLRRIGPFVDQQRALQGRLDHPALRRA